MALSHAPVLRMWVARRRSFRVSPSPAAITNTKIRVVARHGIDRHRQSIDLGRQATRPCRRSLALSVELVQAAPRITSVERDPPRLRLRTRSCRRLQRERGNGSIVVTSTSTSSNMIGSSARRRATSSSAARWSSPIPRWGLMSAWIAGRPRLRSRIVLAASNLTRSSGLSSSSARRSTAWGDSSASRVRSPSGGLGRPPALPVVPGNQCPRASRAMKPS